MKIKHLLTLAALCVVSAAALTGCASNKQQVVDATSGDGFYGKIAVPLGSSIGSLGLSGFIGRFNSTVAVNPTATNGTVSSAALTVAVAGQGKQGLTGSAGTNNVAGMTDAGGDFSVVNLGGGAVTGTGGTNRSLTVTGH